MSRSKEEFVPIEPGKVKLYACGPTVYNYFHIGNARAFLFFDVVRRYFEFRGMEVTYVQNITDIDDKIIAQSIEEGVPFSEVAAKYSLAFLEDTQRLGIKAPHFQPRATDVMPGIIELIHALQMSGHAYEVDGDVYFATDSISQYGSLSGKKVEEQMTGARVAENTKKHNAADFTLWKHAKAGEPEWDSPWGKGRPGWHSECVVMSRQYLGETFDIHGGGVDLVFPHHENEQAQAYALTGKPLANYWMHNGFLNIDGEKMSKSLRNFFTAREILAEYDAEVIRFFFLSKHYRSPIDFNREIIAESARALKNFHAAFKSVDFLNVQYTKHIGGFESAERDFVEAMDDDFNTAKAIAVLFDLAHKTRSAELPMPERIAAAQMLYHLGSALGFFQNLEEPAQDINHLTEDLIKLIISYRVNARTEKNWALSDKIRDDLKALGVILNDTKEGCTWTVES